MKKVRYARLLAALLTILTACNLPQIWQPALPTIDITRDHRTAEVRITEVKFSTATITSSPRPTETPGFKSTPTGVLTMALPTTPAGTATPTVVCDLAAAGVPIDITIPDDTVMQPGQSFTKIWRLNNAGGCTWTRDYQVALFSGVAMSAEKSFPLPTIVPPGESVDIAVDMVAPQKGGSYQGNWKLRNPQEAWFGIGPDGAAPFWVRIIVVIQATVTQTPAPPRPRPTDEPTLTATPLPPTPTDSPVPPTLTASPSPVTSTVTITPTVTATPTVTGTATLQAGKNSLLTPANPLNRSFQVVLVWAHSTW